MVRYHLARVNYSRSKRHGEAQWKKDHWKAIDARRGARRKDHDSIVIRWQGGEKYRESRKAQEWTEEFCRYLDQLTTTDISFTAPWHQRHQYENTIMLVCNDDDRQVGPMRTRKDFQIHHANSHKFSTRTRTTEFLFSKNEIVRQRPFDEALRADLEWHNPNWKTYWSQTSSSSSSQQWWQHEHQDTQWRDQNWWKG